MSRLLPLILLSSLAWAQQPSPVPRASVEASASDVAATHAAATGDIDRLLPAVEPPPPGDATRVGGTIREMDSVLDRFTIDTFGGGEVKVVFDTRTNIYRGAVKVPSRSLRAGERVAVDTVLDGTQIFARNIRILSSSPVGESNGRVVAYDTGKGELRLRDPLSQHTVRVRFAPYTMVLRNGTAVSREELHPGDLVAVEFVSDGDGHAFAHQVSILATPGKTFYFLGRVTHLDLHLGLLVVTDSRNNASYEIGFDPNVLPIPSNLQEGGNVLVTASFEGRRYLARTIEVDPRF